MTKASSNAERAALSRRNFLQLTATGLAGAAGYTLLGGRSSAAPARGGSSAAPAWGRQPGGHRPSGAASNVTSLDGGWLFGGLFVAGSDQSTFDDRAFLDVTLPHCVTPLAWREWDTATWEQQWIYRRHFDLPRGADQMRTFLDFAGVLTGATPTLNGKQLPEHLGGYLPFSYEITDGVSTTDNVLAVEVDSRWLYVPPEGSPAGPKAVDYLEPGGISRGVALRVVPQVFLADVFAKPVGVLEPSPSVQVSCTVDAAVVPPGPVEVVVELLDGDRTRSRASTTTTITSPGQTTVSLQLDAGQGIGRWSPDNPKLYEVLTTLSINGRPIHDFTRTIGFRDAVFDVDGFFLNGQRLKIFGLDRHQIFPYAGMSIPARVQRRDALILKQQLNCNMVRCSHYPQSSHFLDACDELGIMVWEETPGWQFIGDATWQAEVVSNVHDMVIRDRNRPSIVLWGVQVNESPREPQLYTQTRDLANSLDGSRQTSGTETSQSLTGWVQEVFAYDDYNSSNGNATLLPPIPGVPYLVTEAVGALDGPPYYRWIDDQPTQADQAKLHAQVHDIAASADAYSGLLAWCGFDYDSDNGNIYQNIKWPGVADTFRVLKPGAAFYQAQVDPRSGPVIQPAFYWDFGPTSPVTSLGSTAAIWSNCDQLEAYLDGRHYATLTPDTAGFPHTAHPPFYLDTTGIAASTTPELRLDGYVAGRKIASRSFSGSTEGDHLQITLNDDKLDADGIDATLVTFRAVDRYGAPRPYVDGDARIDVRGPGTWVGQTLDLAVTASPALATPGQVATVTATLTNGGFPFAANGGVGGVLIRTIAGRPGGIDVEVSHPTLGSQRAHITALPIEDPSPAPGPGGIVPPDGPPPLTDVTVALSAPAGWTVDATSPTTFAGIDPGASVSSTWQVTVAAPSTAGGVAGPQVGAQMLIEGRPSSAATAVPISVALTLAQAYDNVGISDDTDVSAADLDGVGNSFSEQTLLAAGLAPGATFTAGGLTFTWPNVPAGQPDNILAAGQTLLVSGTGSTLGFVGAGSPADEGGRGTVTYTDGSTSSFTVSLGNYFNTSAAASTPVVTLPYINDSAPNNNYQGVPGRRNHTGTVFYAGVPITAGKTVKAVTLPTGASVNGGRITAMHVFAVAIG